MESDGDVRDSTKDSPFHHHKQNVVIIYNIYAEKATTGQGFPWHFNLQKDKQIMALHHQIQSPPTAV